MIKTSNISHQQILEAYKSLYSNLQPEDTSIGIKTNPMIFIISFGSSDKRSKRTFQASTISA
jgi:hypothetical protein